ncbi:lysophospholipid acyltransferase family protein [Streptomyces sp. NPDC002018]|uniref:lysophospholipid acyltransferase family protein n=1 Tax=Streptomyces sp. NPDC002018 TaxID=3364629 RepID=UPI0036C837CE
MSVWLPTAPCTPRGCAAHNGPAVAPVTAAGRLLAGTALVLAGVLLTPLVSLLGAAHRDRLTRLWARTVIRAFGLRIRITGEPAPPRGGGTLVVSNHISWLDIPLLAAVFPGRMLAKSEIRGWPVLGAMATQGGTVFVERERLRALPGTVRTLADALSDGSRVIVFPEACTWCGQDHGRFTTAVFQAALDADADVRPVRLTYRGPGGEPSGAPAYVGDDSLGASLWRVVTAGGLTAEITVLPVIPAGRHTGRGTLSEAAQTAVASESANRPASSVHQRVSSIPAADSSARTPS